MNGCELFACSLIRFGKNCMIGPQTIFMDSDFHGISQNERMSPGKTYPIIVEENVWIGSRCMILNNVHIGKDAVIAAGSVVTKDIEAGNVVGGNPARKIGNVYP